MIKPVRRNKRLKWIDSHYAYQHRLNIFVDMAINQVAIDWGCPVDMLLGKSSELLSNQEKRDFRDILKNQWQDKLKVLNFITPS